MNVSRRIALLLFIASFLMSMYVTCAIYFYHLHTDHHLQLIVAIFVVAILIGISGKLIDYQQALTRAKQNLEEAQQLAGLGSWERDLESGKGYWSDNHYRLFGLCPGTLAPSMEEFFSMIHTEDRSKVRQAVMEVIDSGGCYEVKYRLERDIGNRMFLSRGRVLHDSPGGAVTLIGTVQDITHKHRRDQFREELLKQKDLFINRLGHDLKTPLTPLVALLPLIRSRTEGQRQQELLDLCINNVTHINELVIKTGQLARLTSSADSISTFVDVPLYEAVDAAVSSLAESIRGRNLTIVHSIPSDVLVRGNMVELEELFRQLLSNAVKFSPSNSDIYVETVRDNGMVAVVVRDSGIGLLPEELPHVFDDFYKADSSRHVLGSSGLGLTICRRIIEKHGGRISASSPGRDGGTTIHFTLEAGGCV